MVNQSEGIREQQREMSIRAEMARALIEQSRPTPEQEIVRTTAMVERWTSANSGDRNIQNPAPRIPRSLGEFNDFRKRQQGIKLMPAVLFNHDHRIHQRS
jgi:hypothetical protein